MHLFITLLLLSSHFLCNKLMMMMMMMTTTMMMMMMMMKSRFVHNRGNQTVKNCTVSATEKVCWLILKRLQGCSDVTYVAKFVVRNTKTAWATCRWKQHDPMIISFDSTPACDKVKGRRTRSSHLCCTSAAGARQRRWHWHRWQACTQFTNKTSY